MVKALDGPKTACFRGIDKAVSIGCLFVAMRRIVTSILALIAVPALADTLDVLRDMGITLGFRANLAAVEGRSALEFPREDHTNVWKLATAS